MTVKTRTGVGSGTARAGGPAANARLTALAGVALLAMLIVQVASALFFALLSFNVPLPVGPVFDLVHPVHFFVGFLLMPVIAIKLGSVGWRFAMYYLGRPAYKAAGPPGWVARLLAPAMVVSAIVLFGSGVEMWSFRNDAIAYWTQVHVLAAICFVAALCLHLAINAGRAHRDAAADLTREPREATPVPGRLTRRALLGAGLASGAALAVSAANWPLPQLSRLYARPVGAGPFDFPTMNYEGGAQRVDVARWRLRVTGAVRTPLSLDEAALAALPSEEHEYPLNCVTGWSATRRWRGVPVAALLEKAGVDAAFGHVRVRSTSGYHWDHDRAHALLRGALLVMHVDGVRLNDDHGFPARLLIPGLQGQSNVKWVDELAVGLGPPELYVAPNLVPQPQPVTGPLLPPDPAGSRG